MKKRWIGMLAAILTASFVLAACSGGSGGSAGNGGGASGGAEAGSGEAAGEKVELTFWRAGTDTLETEYWERVIGDFEAANPGIVVKLTSIPWGNDIETKLNAAFVSNTAPDVISFSIASVAARASLGHYKSLEPFVADWEGKGDIVPKILESGTYDGELYGLGFIPDPRIFVWRKDHFLEAGLDPEQPPTTWEQLKDYAVRLTEKDGGVTSRAGFHFGTEINNGDAAQTWQSFALQNGNKIIDTSKHEAYFAEPSGIEAAAFLAELAREGVNFPGKQDQDPFAAGKASMTFTNPNTVRSLINEHPELEGEIGYALPIEREQKATFAGLRLLFMGSQTKHEDEAWTFISYLMTAEETWKRYEQMEVPVVLQSLKDRYIEDNPDINQAIYEGVEVGQGYPMVPYSFTFMEIISRALQQAYFGEKSAEDAFLEADAEFKRQLPALQQ